ncbi:aspartate aminotransferase family protein [Legionella maioricensis]|uniref:Aminotransferase class III-fold pyridoxal phosphate-dependent enzyme n=1 Tax=Legionella maioricensis TaxID=2896528 RepID=A0A9X2D0P2_9GAMM|nr:aminotransferase class III-fold pyridoxal phosphate-dependent enzyme [Legionella maioricensis]MCL9684271.1 aminotransferase class III-fold pyridoxal phosphate-dependent enzyme [Legionella maioricensis]MCL9687137.1 aminotransferase class III-fold pyridoxal phosphate-dependent enzyme [Legionella maioricensis]
MDIPSLLKKDSQYCSYGDTVHYANPPKFFADCNGSYLYDSDGTPYLDLQMWYSAVNFGYKNQQLSDVLKRQIDRLPQLACQYLHPEKIELAEALCKNIEERTGQKGRIHFNVGGSQAIEDALKLVRNETKKNLMFAFMGGYHGRTLGASSITSSYRYRRRYGHFSDRAFFQPFPYCFRCPYEMKREKCGLYCVNQFKKLFDTEYNSVWDDKAGEAEYGAFFIEFIQGTGGYVIPPPGYFQELAKTLKEHNILLVADEIQMGFYRTGKFWSFEHFGVTPDIIVFGKALTNGLNPISGIWAKEDLISPQKFPPGSTHSTYSSNPLGTAVGLEVMKLLADGKIEKNVNEQGAYFLEQIKELKTRWKMIGDVDGLGMALRIELCEEDGHTPNRKLADAIFNEGLKGDLEVDNKKYGLVLDIGGYYKNVFTLAPSLMITRDEIDLGIKLLEVLLKRCGAA